MEAQILRYYLKVSSFLFFILILFFFIYIILIKEISIKNDYFFINKNQNYIQIIDQNINDNKVNIFFYKLFLRISLFNNIKIHYGKFKLSDNNNFIDLINTISNPGNYFEKITVIEGSTKIDLNKILKENFDKFKIIDYDKILADTYFINYGSSFADFERNFNNIFNKFKQKYKQNKLLDRFSFKEIFIIGSLLEKEGLDIKDKKNIYSVIINRLDKKMKLQIDATVIYAITNGSMNLNRKLNYEDLKIPHNYNTYYIYGLPPEPISYVGLKTIELIFENYSTNYLFYFYNTLENKHIYSINYKNHLNKLNEYRSKK